MTQNNILVLHTLYNDRVKGEPLNVRQNRMKYAMFDRMYHPFRSRSQKSVSAILRVIFFCSMLPDKPRSFTTQSHICTTTQSVNIIKILNFQCWKQLQTGLDKLSITNIENIVWPWLRFGFNCCEDKVR